MTSHDCADRFREFREVQNRILEEDIEALQRLSNRERIERYNNLKRKEELFDTSFLAECPSFLTDSERDRIRGEFRLARLLLAASFYAEGEVPRALADEFTTPELEAVVAFDRYSIFDTLSEEQIERKIRRMEGEVYELVAEYTSTQLSNIEALTEQPDIQQSVVDRLLARYAERRQKIRQGFFIYVETHGLEHTVGIIEDAVRTVADASDERSTIRAEFRATLNQDSPSPALDSNRRDIESEVTAIAGESCLDEDDALPAGVIGERVSEVVDKHEAAVDDLKERIDRLKELERRLESKVEDLSQVRNRTESIDSRTPEEMTAVVDAELNALREDLSELRSRRDRVELQHDRLDHAQQRLSAYRHAIEMGGDQGDDGEPAAGVSPTIDASGATSASVARLMEMDYLGRFDISMSNVTEITTPDGNVTVPEGYWEDRSERRSERTRLARLLNREQEPSEYPRNQTARYEITNDRYLGLSRTAELIIEATVYTTLESHVHVGFDAQPASLDDLLRFVNDAVHEAEERDCAYLLAVASPTGWSDEVYDRFTGDDVARSRFSERVSVILVDLRTGEVTYDDADIVAAENAHLFEPVIDAERVSAAVETIRKAYFDDVGSDTIAVETIVQEHGFDRHIVTQAFHRLADSDDGDLLYLDELGLCLEVGD